MRDNSQQAQSSQNDLQIQGKTGQSPGNEDKEKTSLIKLLVKQVLESPQKESNDGGIIHQERREGVPRDTLRTSRTLSQNKAKLKLMKKFMITDAIQYQTWYHHETPGHTFLHM